MMAKRLDKNILHQAADWWTSLRDPNCAPETVERWLAWTREDECHLEAFECVTTFGNRFGKLDELTRRKLLVEFGHPAALPRLRLLFAAAACLLVLLSASYLARNWFRSSEPPQSYASAVAQNRDITLSDGTAVALGGASSLTTRFDKGARRIDLSSGEAFFRVAHDTRRPFVVTAGDVSIRDIGTAFDVRRAKQRVTIAVTEGQVQVSPKGATASDKGAITAVAGQLVSYDPAEGIMHIGSVTPEQAIAWRNDRLEFVNEPLAVVVANINRYSAQPLHIADADLERLSFTGTVRIDALDSWLNALPQIFPLQVTKGAHQVVLSRVNHQKLP